MCTQEWKWIFIFSSFFPSFLSRCVFHFIFNFFSLRLLFSLSLSFFTHTGNTSVSHVEIWILENVFSSFSLSHSWYSCRLVPKGLILECWHWLFFTTYSTWRTNDFFTMDAKNGEQLAFASECWKLVDIMRVLINRLFWFSQSTGKYLECWKLSTIKKQKKRTWKFLLGKIQLYPEY